MSLIDLLNCPRMAILYMNESNSRKGFQMTNNEKNIINNYTVWDMRSTIRPLNL